MYISLKHKEKPLASAVLGAQSSRSSLADSKKKVFGTKTTTISLRGEEVSSKKSGDKSLNLSTSTEKFNERERGTSRGKQRSRSRECILRSSTHKSGEKGYGNPRSPSRSSFNDLPDELIDKVRYSTKKQLNFGPSLSDKKNKAFYSYYSKLDQPRDDPLASSQGNMDLFSAEKNKAKAAKGKENSVASGKAAFERAKDANVVESKLEKAAERKPAPHKHKRNISPENLFSDQLISFPTINACVDSESAKDSTSVVPTVSNIWSTKEKSRNIKVFCRFRPCNQIEEELVNNGLGSICAFFPSEQSVGVKPENQIFTLDKAYSPHTLQSRVYEEVGKETVEDVLNGYNGTIFAYGPTGSGKTYTMFGDIEDNELRGIIPRAVREIFTYIENIDFEVDYMIKASMLEIYKETLNDLLTISKTDLKIKENPIKGIYIQGLTQIAISSEFELMEVLEIGNQTRTVKATRINEYSSRSHTIFTVEITQRYPNEAEKKGKLNLIDLAGSEKVSKSGVSGDMLEEAKKINLSLSCLGNVIHALTSNSDHVPFRDSKLTRILQESLGGNYKTSLIVTCSPHSSVIEETMSTLKFANRAKAIKTSYKMNIKTSPATLNHLIDQMKNEILETKSEISRYRLVFQRFKEQLQDPSTRRLLEGQSHILETIKHFEEGSMPQEVLKRSEFTGEEKEKYLFSKSKLHITNTSMAPHSQNNDSNITTNDEILTILSQETSAKSREISQLQTENTQLEAMVRQKDKEIHLLKISLSEKNATVKENQKDLAYLRKELLDCEKQLTKYKEEKQLFDTRLSQETSLSEYLKFQIEIFQKQINSLTEHIAQADTKIDNLLKEKKQIVDAKFQDFIRSNLDFKETKLAEYFSQSINFNFELQEDRQLNLINPAEANKASFLATEIPENDKGSFIVWAVGANNQNNFDAEIKSSFIGKLDLENAFANTKENITQSILFPGKIENLLGSSGQPISKDLIIYYLKQQIINANIVNQHLERVISALEWKQIIEYGKARMKSNLSNMQARHISLLEQVLEKTAQDHRNLRERIESVELDGILAQEEKFRDLTNMCKGDCSDVKKRILDSSAAKRILKPLNKNPNLQRSFLKQMDEAELTMNTQTSCQETPCVERNFLSYGNESCERRDEEAVQDNSNEFLFEVERLKNESLPLTYENSIAVIKRKNHLIMKLINSLTSRKMNPVGNSPASYLEKYENERLQNKILTLQSELDLERTKAKQYHEAFLLGQRQIENFKKLNEEMEIASRNNLREENKSWQSIINNIKEINESELQRRHKDMTAIYETQKSWGSKLEKMVGDKELSRAVLQDLMKEIKAQTEQTQERIEGPQGNLNQMKKKGAFSPINIPSISRINNFPSNSKQEKESL